MNQTVIIIVVVLGILGGGYFLLNPSNVYVSPENIEFNEVVIDDGESTLQKKFSGNPEEREIINEGLTKTIVLPTSTPVVEEIKVIEPVVPEKTPEEIAEEKRLERVKTLPLGDGNISNSPKVGNVFSCQEDFPKIVDRRPPWIQKDLWYPNLKIAVSGNVNRTNASLLFEISGSSRIIKGNGLPKHATGEFPISANDKAYQYDRNPNSIGLKEIIFVVPIEPEIAGTPSCLPMGTIGITLSGAPMFSALDAGGRDALAHEVQDKCGGHPEKNGIYHYHAEKDCLTNYAEENASTTPSLLIGYALDGFGIYSSEEYGETLTNNDLDSCHGHRHTILWDEEETDIYHYHATPEYPYTLGCFMGTPILDNTVN